MNHLSLQRLATELGLRLEGSQDSYLSDRSGLAALVRQSVYRRGIVTRRELANDWRNVFQVFGETFAAIRDRLIEVADALAALGDLVHVAVGREHGWAKASPRWISLNSGHAVALGAIQPSLVERAIRDIPCKSNHDVPRRFNPCTPVGEELVKEVDAIAFSEWAGEPDWFALWNRRGGEMGDIPSLHEFWDLLRSRLRESELTSDNDSSLRILGGSTGEYFGRHYAESLEGRWRTARDLDDGDYLAARQGFQEKDWRFLVVEVRQGRVWRVLQLESSEEFRWGVLGRGLAYDDEERIDIGDDEVRLTFPPPNQIKRVLNLYGWRSKGWTWRLAAPLSAERLEFWRSRRPFS